MIKYPRYFLELSYKGTAYHGWQLQENAHTVQAEINKALELVLQSKIETLGAGRTDTGVHARQFFAHFDYSGRIPENAIHQLNGILPGDIIAIRIIPVKLNANARFDATKRTYEYWIYRNKNPFLREYACFFPFDLDMSRMNEAAELLLKQEDFKCFAKSNSQVKTTLCQVFSAGWKVSANGDLGEKIVFEISANRFLRNMVRAIVGTLLKVGKCEISLEDFRQILINGKRTAAGVSVPANGLYLTAVEYDWENMAAENS